MRTTPPVGAPHRWVDAHVSYRRYLTVYIGWQQECRVPGTQAALAPSARQAAQQATNICVFKCSAHTTATLGIVSMSVAGVNKALRFRGGGWLVLDASIRVFALAGWRQIILTPASKF